VGSCGRKPARYDWNPLTIRIASIARQHSALFFTLALLFAAVAYAEEAAKVTLFYPFSGIAYDSTQFILDGKPLAKFAHGRKLQVVLAPGKHTLAATKYRAIKAVPAKEFIFDGGGEYFISLEVVQTSPMAVGSG
jgi:hypothetical protein